MPWDSLAFGSLRDEVEGSARGRSPSTGVPFFVFIHDPADAVRSVRAFEQLAAALGTFFPVQTIYLGQVMAGVLRRTLYLADDGRSAEARGLDRVTQELSRPAGLTQMITSGLLDGIDGVVEPLRDGSQDHIALIVRTGAVYPFAHVSQILNGLENQTRWTVAIAFPGSRHPQRPDSLRFLNETEGPYYRARVIG